MTVKKKCTRPAALHDIAIPGVDRPIIRRWLRDPEKCNRDEMKLIEQHPIHAVEMLKPYPMFKEAELIPSRPCWTSRNSPATCTTRTPFEP